MNDDLLLLLGLGGLAWWYAKKKPPAAPPDVGTGTDRLAGSGRHTLSFSSTTVARGGTYRASAPDFAGKSVDVQGTFNGAPLEVNNWQRFDSAGNVTVQVAPDFQLPAHITITGIRETGATAWDPVVPTAVLDVGPATVTTPAAADPVAARRSLWTFINALQNATPAQFQAANAGYDIGLTIIRADMMPTDPAFAYGVLKILPDASHLQFGKLRSAASG